MAVAELAMQRGHGGFPQDRTASRKELIGVGWASCLPENGSGKQFVIFP